MDTNINLEALIEQRSEATGFEGDRVPFEFGGKTFTFRDPLMLTDDEKDELADLQFDPDVAAWYMGDDQYEDFLATSVKVTDPTTGKKVERFGSSNFFFLVFSEYSKRSRETDAAGKSTRGNRSSRRSAARKRRKQA